MYRFVLLSLAAVLLAAPAARAQKRNLYSSPMPQSPSQPQQQPQQPNNQPPPAPPQPMQAPVLSSEPYVGGSSGFLTPSYASAQYGQQGGGYGYPYGGYYGRGGGIGSLGRGYQSGAALQGLSSYNESLGNYQIQIQEARALNEQVHQAQIDTARKKLMWEMEYYEKYRPTAPKMQREQDEADLEWARNYAQNTQIWSGSTLNILMKNILKSSTAFSGPTVELDEKQLAGLNLTDNTTRANLSLAKDQGRIAWPEALQEEPFDTLRDRFEKEFAEAVKVAETGEKPSIKLTREMRADLQKLQDKLKDNVKDIDPSRYIEAKRTLNQLNETVRGFSDERLVKSMKSDWRRNVRTVADLMAYCQKNGLQFGPATAPGDYVCYTSTYYALRSYDRAMSR